MENDDDTPWTRRLEIELRSAYAEHGIYALLLVIERILDIARDYKIDLDEMEPKDSHVAADSESHECNVPMLN